MQVATVHLHGKLVGPWVEELRTTVETLGRDGTIRLNLEHLAFADVAGLLLLQRLQHEGVELLAVQPLIAGMLASQSGTDSGEPHQVQHA